MEFRFQHSIGKSDLLSLAQKMTRSKLINKSMLKSIPTASLKKQKDKDKEKEKEKEKEESIQPIKTNLIYSNIVQNKERSRSVNAMMSSLLKQTKLIQEPQKIREGNTKGNIKQFVELNASFCTSISGSDESIANGGAVTTSSNSNNNNNSNQKDKLNTSFMTQSPSNSKLPMTSRLGSFLNGSCQTPSTYSMQPTKKNIEPLDLPNQSTITQCITTENIDSSTITQPRVRRNYYSFINSPSTSFYKNTFLSTHTNNNNGAGTMNPNNSFYCPKNISGPNGQKLQGNVVTFIQLEDLIVLEEKLYHILDSFRFGKPVPKICIEWWTFYIYSSFCGKFESLFTEGSPLRNIAHEASILELLSIILTYETLKDPKIQQSTINTLKNLINVLHQNFLVMVDLILTRISSQSMTNIWINKIQNIILSKRSHRIYKNEHMNAIKKNNDYITSIFKNIIRLYTQTNKIDTSSLNFYLKQIQKISIKSVNDYFRKKINQDFCKTGDSLTFIISEAPVMPNIPVPYLSQKIPLEKRKPFTLVIDLDETLISFRTDENRRGLLRLRPGIHQFLSELQKTFEMILFTAGTQEYADPIVDAIEKNAKYFDKRLYRQHCVIMDNVFVKDLSKLGRNLSKVIIIDNMPHNFRLQKDNGIFIKNFYGEDQNDTALIDLIPILKTIASNPNNDVRRELKKMENEIFSKITTNLKDEQ